MFKFTNDYNSHKSQAKRLVYLKDNPVYNKFSCEKIKSQMDCDGKEFKESREQSNVSLTRLMSWQLHKRRIINNDRLLNKKLIKRLQPLVP